MPLKNNRIIFEDECLLVIDKPSGLTVNKAETTKNQETIEDWLPESDLPRRGIVHRLDKATSGLLLIAKNRAALINLQKQFKDRLIKKTYLALVHGRLSPKTGTIRLPLARQPFNRHRFGVFIDGKAAETSYKILWSDREFSWLEVYPKTGRTHQIRVHFKHLGHPLAADPIYGGKKTLKNDLKWCPRLFLHSHKIEFSHPLSQKIINLTAALPYDLQTALEKIKPA